MAAPVAKSIFTQLPMKMKHFGRPGLTYPNDFMIKILHVETKVAVILTFAQCIDLL
jgi:hypothetical protein